MQQPLLRKPKSHLMQLTDIARKKARRRLLGSICLLIFALLLLLNVTSRMKPDHVTPTTVEINSTARVNPALNTTITESTVIPKIIASEPQTSPSANSVATTTAAVNSVHSKAASAPANIIKDSSQQLEQSGTIVPHAPNTQTSAAHAAIKNTTSEELTPDDTADEALPKFAPRITSETTKAHAKLSPMDILNGASEENTPVNKKFFVQLTSSSNKDRIIKLQKALAHREIHTSIQKVTRQNDVVYRLRLGPFSSQEKADAHLEELNQKLEE